jgi:hypothetical protein
MHSRLLKGGAHCVTRATGCKKMLPCWARGRIDWQRSGRGSEGRRQRVWRLWIMRNEDKTDMTASPRSGNQIRADITQSQRNGCARGCWVWEPAVILSPFPFLPWPPLLSTGQSSWLQIQRSGFDSWRYQVHSASWVQLRSYLQEK